MRSEGSSILSGVTVTDTRPPSSTAATFVSSGATLAKPYLEAAMTGTFLCYELLL